jgi:hypothetical protein
MADVQNSVANLFNAVASGPGCDGVVLPTFGNRTKPNVGTDAHAGTAETSLITVFGTQEYGAQ